MLLDTFVTYVPGCSKSPSVGPSKANNQLTTRERVSSSSLLTETKANY